jgi:hypothetical protein
MTLETVLQGIKTYTAANLNTYLAANSDAEITLDTIDTDQIVFFELDPDKIRFNLVMGIVPDADAYEPDGMASYEVSSDISIFFALRGHSFSELKWRSIRTVGALSDMILEDETLGGAVADVTIREVEWIETDNDGLQGAEVRLSVIWEL